jgi:hypothetical protein
MGSPGDMLPANVTKPRKPRRTIPWSSRLKDSTTSRFRDGAQAFEEAFKNAKPFFGPIPKLKKTKKPDRTRQSVDRTEHDPQS